jgi:hypothetical protein
MVAAHAADASGVLTTTIQLGQAVGVATFGSLFLTLDAGRDSVLRQAVISESHGPSAAPAPGASAGER